MLGFPPATTHELVAQLTDVLGIPTDTGDIPIPQQEALLLVLGYAESRWVPNAERTRAVEYQLEVHRQDLIRCALQFRLKLPVTAQHLRYLPSPIKGLYHVEAFIRQARDYDLSLTPQA